MPTHGHKCSGDPVPAADALVVSVQRGIQGRCAKVPDSSAMYPDEAQLRGLRDNLLPRRITESQHLVPLCQRSVFDAYAQG